MRNLVKYLTCASLAICYPLQLHADQLSPKQFNQLMVNVALDKLLKDLKTAKSGEDLAKLARKVLPARDHEFVTAQLKQIKKMPKFTRLNRGFEYMLEGKKYTFVIDDLYQQKFTVNGRVPWTYSADNPLSVQVESVGKILAAPTTGWLPMLVPEAHALGPLAGLLIGMIIGPMVAIIVNKLLYPMAEEAVCTRVDTNRYAFKQFCENFVKDLATSKKGNIPTATNPPAEAEARAVPSVVPRAPKCRTQEDPSFVHEIDIKVKESTVTVRRTITYDEHNKPKEMVEEIINPPDTTKRIYIIKDNILWEVHNEKNEPLVSRDPARKEWMTPQKWQQMTKLDEALNEEKPFVEGCDEKARTALETAASQPGSLVSSILNSESTTVQGPARNAPSVK